MGYKVKFFLKRRITQKGSRKQKVLECDRMFKMAKEVNTFIKPIRLLWLFSFLWVCSGHSWGVSHQLTTHWTWVWILIYTKHFYYLLPTSPRQQSSSLLYPLRLSQAERLSILQSLSSKLKLSAEVDLNVVADRTNGFTGADLQAVLFTAQMTAYEALHQGMLCLYVTYM